MTAQPLTACPAALTAGGPTPPPCRAPTGRALCDGAAMRMCLPLPVAFALRRATRRTGFVTWCARQRGGPYWRARLWRKSRCAWTLELTVASVAGGMPVLAGHARVEVAQRWARGHGGV